MECGWLPRVIDDKNGGPSSALKPKQEWNRLDNDASGINVKAFYCIFNGFSLDLGEIVDILAFIGSFANFSGNFQIFFGQSID